jgi:hypothetical protein
MKRFGDEVFGSCNIREYRVRLTSPEGGADETRVGRSFVEKGKCQEFLLFSSEQANQKEWGLINYRFLGGERRC